MIRTLVLAATLALIAGCGDGGSRVTGIVLEVDGDLESVKSFTIRTEDGRMLEFVPAPDFTFHNGPASHLSEHVRSGAPVEVLYEDPSGSGPLLAVFVDDG